MRTCDLLWATLPEYAALFLKPRYERLTNIKDHVLFYYWMEQELEYTDNEAKKICLRLVMRYVYEKVTGRSFESKQFKEV